MTLSVSHEIALETGKFQSLIKHYLCLNFHKNSIEGIFVMNSALMKFIDAETRMRQKNFHKKLNIYEIMSFLPDLPILLASAEC